MINELKERDELTVKIEELEKTIEENTAREAELQKAADQARTLKDEVDILREDAAKVSFIKVKFALQQICILEIHKNHVIQLIISFI